MLNNFILVGRIKELKVEDTACFITLAVTRNFKNEDGIYETDFIPVVLNGRIAEQTQKYCKKGDIIGAKGIIKIEENEMILLADKISFLSGKSEEINNEIKIEKRG